MSRSGIRRLSSDGEPFWYSIGMTSLYTHASQNIWRTWALMAAFLCVVVLVGWLASEYFGNAAILYGSLFFALATNVFAYWNSDKVAIANAGAVPADEAQYQELHRIVENLAITAGLPKPRVYIIDDPAPNAFATGRDAKHACVAVTTGLLAMMDRAELEGVLAHELSHVGNRDILVMTVAVVLVGFISGLANMALHLSYFGGGDNRDRGPLIAIATVFAMILAPLGAQLIQLAISRKREFLADASGALLTRYPEGLASALQKIGSYAAPMERASATTAHLFISNPFGAHEAGKFFATLFSTHPPVEERVAALKGMVV